MMNVGRWRERWTRWCLGRVACLARAAARGERVRGIQTNVVSHQQQAVGDTFFQHVHRLPRKTVAWGPVRVAPPSGDGEEAQRG